MYSDVFAHLTNFPLLSWQGKQQSKKRKKIMDRIIEGVDVVYAPAAIEGDEQSQIHAKMWHGKQTNCPVTKANPRGEILLDGSNVGDAFCPILQVGMKLDFDTLISTVPDDDTELKDTAKVMMDSHKAIIADCRKGLAGRTFGIDKAAFLIHVPKKGYVIHDNRRRFDDTVKAMTKVFGDKGYTIVTLGTVGCYSQFMMSIAIKGQEVFDLGKLANGVLDTYTQYLNIHTSHNGEMATAYLISLIRAVCWNTMNASTADAEQSGKIQKVKHTLNSLDLITPEVIEANVKLWMTKSASFRARLAQLKEYTMTSDQFCHFAAGVFTTEKSDELSSTSYNRIQDMQGLFMRGNGNIGATRYDALNAFTDYFTHGVGKDLTPEKRIAMANFGRGNDWKNIAMRDALPLDEKTGKPNKAAFERLVSRGRTLYNDKHKVVMAEAAAN